MHQCTTKAPIWQPKAGRPPHSNSPFTKTTVARALFLRSERLEIRMKQKKVNILQRLKEKHKCVQLPPRLALRPHHHFGCPFPPAASLAKGSRVQLPRRAPQNRPKPLRGSIRSSRGVYYVCARGSFSISLSRGLQKALEGCERGASVRASFSEP